LPFIPSCRLPYNIIMLKSLSLLKVGIILTGVLASSRCWAQVTGIEGTNTPLVGNQFNISGGQPIGTNLFHSFSQFGLNPGQIANFVANPGIQNILGRVTGDNASIINGSIQITGGNPNLYLMNPSGFVFGTGASLNVPGSFTATTASAIEIGNQQWFNAIAPNNYPALNGAPGGLAFTMTQPGAIVNQGNLAVTAPGSSLSLVAGSVSSSGTLSAPIQVPAQLTIVAVPGSSLVRVSSPGSPLGLVIDPLSSAVGNQPAGGNFTIESIPRLLTLGNATLPPPVATTFGAGDVALNAMTANAVDIFASNKLTAAGNITTAGRTSLQAGGDISSQTVSTQGGNLSISSINGSINNEGTLNTTNGEADAGSITLNAQNNISTGSLRSNSESANSNSGNSGNISIESRAGNINVVDAWANSTGSSNVPSQRAGNGGSISLKARGDVNIGTGFIRSYSASNQGIASNAGNITFISEQGNITTGLIEAYTDTTGNNIANNGTVAGNGGSVTLLAPNGNITTNYIVTYSRSGVTGDGGAVTLAANSQRGVVNLSGTNSYIQAFSKSGNAGNINITAGTETGGINIGGYLQTNSSSERKGTINLSAAAIEGRLEINKDIGEAPITINGFVGRNPSTTFVAPFTSNLQIAGGIILSGAPSQRYQVPVTLVGNATFGNDRTSSVTFTQPVSIGNNSLTITAGNIDFQKPITGTGNVLLQPQPNQTIQIGGSISQQTFFKIASGSNVGSVIVSRPDNSNNVLFVGETQFNTPLSIRANTISHTNSTLRGTGSSPLTLQANQISVGNIINPGQPITLASERNLTTGNLDTSAPTAQAGSINLRSDQGSIVTGTLNSSGSIGNNTTILARTAVTTGSINTSGSQGSGGNLLIDPIGDVQTGSINTQGGNLGSGGNIRIVAGQLFRATETFTDRNNTLASISAAGGLGGGRIEIFHGGGSRNIRFNVGDATTNGTAGAITNGINSILPPRSFLGSFRIGDIRLVTTNPQTPCDISSCPTPKTNVPPNKQASRDDQPLVTYLPDHQHDAEFRAYLGTLPGTLATQKNATPIDIQRKLRAIKSETNGAVKPAIVYLTFVSAYTAPNKTAWLQSLVDHDPQYQQVLWKFDSSGNAANYITEQQPQENQTPQDNDQLEIIILTTSDSIIRKRVPDATRKNLSTLAKDFLKYVSTPEVDVDAVSEDQIKKSGNELYEYLIAPVNAELNAQGINNLTFIADQGIRGIPFTALHDKETYLAEKYSIALMPSFSLTDTRYTSLKNAQLLALNAFTVNEDKQWQADNINLSKEKNLPYAAFGVDLITNKIWIGKALSQEEFTPDNLKRNRDSGKYGIVHIATHANFSDKELAKSSIDFWSGAIGLDQINKLELDNPPTNLLVLVACETAIPDPRAELGFAGIAAKTGASSVVATLWNVEQTGSFGLITKFYHELKKAPVKVQALQNAQRALLLGEVYIDKNGILQGLDNNSSIEISAVQKQLEKDGKFNETLFSNKFKHPYYWAGFTLIGNPW
jgi:filamentous hemagglutinin family protein